MLDLSAIPLVDNHCHSLLKDQGPYDLTTWRAFFSESLESSMWNDHVQHTAYYLWSMNQLAEEFGCEPTEDAVLAYHNEHRGDGLCARLLRKSHYDTLMMDNGVPGPERGMPHPRVAELGAFKIGDILRLEVRQGQLIAESDTFEQFVERYREETSTLRRQGFKGAKSVAAYRGGLEIGPPDEAAAREAFGPLKETAKREGKVRVGDKRLLDFTLHLALEQLARQQLPLQFHTGFGDTDEDLRTGNPLCLRSLLEEKKYWGAPIILIHESWPWTREAALLTLLYPHVYMDVSFAIPHLGQNEMVRFTQAALSAAPASKTMFATDSWGLAEQYFLGAKRGRAIVGRVLDDMVSEGELRAEQAERMAELILNGTARAVYQLS
jgi:hypothetical protein